MKHLRAKIVDQHYITALEKCVDEQTKRIKGLTAALDDVERLRKRVEALERQNELFDDVERARDLLDGVPVDGPAYKAAAILDAVLLNCAASPTASSGEQHGDT